MFRRTSLVIPALVLFASIANAQHWETWDKTYSGHIGKYAISLEILNRFGKLQGWYHYTIYDDSIKKGNNGGYIVHLKGDKEGNSISLDVSCFYCQSVTKPETFTGTISGTTIKGTWTKKHGKRATLPFEVTEVVDTSSYETPPHDPGDIKQYHGKSLWASRFFEQPFVIQELSSVLGKDLQAYIEFLKAPMAHQGLGVVNDTLLTTEVWVDHNGTSDHTIIAVDLLTKQFYVFWIGSPSDSEYIKIYGKDIPLYVLRYFADSMNSMWGHVHKYIIHGQTIEMVEREE